MKASVSGIDTKLSSTVVSTCSTVKASATSDRLRWSASVTNLGQPEASNRTDVSRPAHIPTVSSTSATSPVALVVYQSGVDDVTTTATDEPVMAYLRDYSLLASRWS